MNEDTTLASVEIGAELIAQISTRLAQGKRVRRIVPGGRLRIDRQLPFLLVYRRPTRAVVPGAEGLVMGEASYLIVSGERETQRSAQMLTKEIVTTLAREFGAFLIVELWTAPRVAAVDADSGDVLPPLPKVKILTLKKGYPSKTAETLRDAVQEIKVNGQKVDVVIERKPVIMPPGMAPLLNRREAHALNCFVLGIEIDPVWYNADTQEVYPLLLHNLRRSFGRALKRAEYTFTTARTTRRPLHYLALGPKSVTQAVWDADARLADIDGSFDLLLAVTPTNPEHAWREFHKSRYDRTPEFYYRPVDVDPDLLKRELYAIPIERIEDPTLSHLFIEKRGELDRCLTMLHDRGGRKMRYESMQLFDVPSSGLVERARQMLHALPGSDRDESKIEQVNAAQFAAMANEEYSYYRGLLPGFEGAVEVRDDISQGLLVSNGTLLIGIGTQFPRYRAKALLQHEVGTHVVTYYNGRAQPLRQLYCGLSGYDEFQEGIAVLSEYLVGGLSSSRLRVLAARVLAVQAMLEGGTFVDVFRHLTREQGFTKRSAFTITMRIFRGGGLTKDAVYLRGLERVLDYLRDGGDVSALFVGKIAARHVPIIRELQLRGVLQPTPLLPRYLSDPDALSRLEYVRKGVTVLDLLPLPERKHKRIQYNLNENRTVR